MLGAVYFVPFINQQEGESEGAVEGEPEGTAEGIVEGAIEGEGVVEGETEGAVEGEIAVEGETEGSVEGERPAPKFLAFLGCGPAGYSNGSIADLFILLASARDWPLRDAAKYT